MPTYEYACEECGHRFEKFQSITANPLRKCPECKKNSVKRLIGTGAGIIFKGNGFYETDYRSESYKKAAEKDKPSSESKSEKKDASAKSETKTESKADSTKKSETKSAKKKTA
jgi:putative FmdB family regulatory protein